MKKRYVFLIIFCLLMFFIGAANAADFHINGPTNAEAISQLQSIGTSHLGDNIYLDMDVDLTGVSWTPIGSSASSYYYGVFDGQGHTISKLSASGTANVALFGYTKNAEIKNLKISQSTFTKTGSGICVGCIVASGVHTSVHECWVDGCTISSNNGVTGAIISSASLDFINIGFSTIQNCIVSGTTISCGGRDYSSIICCADSNIINCYVSPDCAISNFGTRSGGIEARAKYNSGNIGTLQNNVLTCTTPSMSYKICYGLEAVWVGANTQNNYAVGGGTDKNSYYGLAVTSIQYNSQSWWQNTALYDFTNTWYWDSSANLPKLRAFMQPPSIATPTGSATVQSGQPLTISAALTNPSGLDVHYNWQVSTDGTTWANTGTSGQTTSTSYTLTYTPTTTISTAAQTYYWRVVWTSDYSSTQSATQAFASDIYNVPAQVTTMSIFTEETVPVQGVYPTGTLIYFDFDDAQYANQYTFYYRPAGMTGSGTLFGTSRSSAAASDSFSTVGTYQIGVTTWNYKSDFSSAYAYSEMKWFDSPLLEIYNPPVITTDIAASPNNPYVKTATNIQLSVTATDSGSGKQTTQYEWYEQPYGSSTWNLLDTTTTNTYTMTGKTYQNTNPYKYKVIVKGYGGSATSSEISVTPQNYPAPTISSVSMASPSGTVYADTYYTLSLQSTVSDPGSAVQQTTYQWYIQTPGSFTFTPISDGNVEDYTKANYVFQTPGTYKYHLTATGQGGSTTSSDLSLTVNQYAAPTISSVIKQAPAESEKDVGEQFQLLLVATVNDPGAGSITGTSIQWYRQYNSGAWEAISGATASTLNIQETYSAAGFYTYKIVVTGSGGTVDSSQLSTPLVITMEAISTTPAPVFTSVTVTPSASPLYPGQSFSVSASASDTNSYVWSARPTSGSTWTQFLAGASGTSSISAAGTYEIRCIATGDGGSTDSSTVSGLERFITVTAWPLPVIQSFTVTPSASPLVAGGYVTLSAQTLNTQSVVYDYRLNTTQSWTVIPGTTQTFTTAGTYYVRCTANNGHGDTTTQTVTVTVIPARVPILTVSITPTSGEIVSSTGTTFVINLEASENDPDNTITYRQWQILSPAAGASWQDTGVVNPRGSYRLDTTQAGTYYFRFVTSGVYDVTSSEKPFNVTISPWIRVMATATVTPVSTQPVNNLIDSIDVTPGEYFDPIDVFEQLLWPYTQGDDLLNSLILLCIFAVPIFMVWLITKNILVPSIIGLIFGVWLLTFLPAGYYGVSVALIALSIVGGIIRIFKPPQ